MEDVRRFEILAELIKRAEGKKMRVGRTHVQKWVYFLQRLGHDDLGYKFVMYHYGPYCFQLASDLDLMRFLGRIDIRRHVADDGFDIKPAEDPDTHFLQKADKEKWQKALDQLLDSVKDWEVKDLERVATADFIKAILENRTGQTPDEQKIIDILRNLKPQPNTQESYERVITQLRQLLPWRKLSAGSA